MHIFLSGISCKDKNKTIKYLLIFIVIMNILSLIEWMYKRKNSISKNVIKQTIDSSNSGILALKNCDKIIFQNTVMYELMEKIDVHENYIESIINKSIEKIGEDYVVLIENKAWLFCINVNKQEITAFDINEEYNLQKELKNRNEKINQNNEELLWTIENLEKIEKEEKTLKIKNKFHDLLGQNLAILKMYLNKERIDEEKINDIKFMINKMFIELENSESSGKELENFIKVNEKIGIIINMQGKLPEDKEKSKVIFEIIREAVTNAVRHANSTEINIKIEEKLSNISIIITNNGLKPKEVIIENEGIKGMRRKLKKINGTLFIKTVPEFGLQISIYNEKI